MGALTGPAHHVLARVLPHIERLDDWKPTGGRGASADRTFERGPRRSKNAADCPGYGLPCPDRSESVYCAGASSRLPWKRNLTTTLSPGCSTPFGRKIRR